MVVIDGHVVARCDVTPCDRFAVYECELTGRQLCDTHRTRCEERGCDHTVTYRCTGCGRALCTTHRLHRQPPPVSADVEAAKVIRGTTTCLGCARARMQR